MQAIYNLLSLQDVERLKKIRQKKEVMPLNIKHPEADRLARELAKRTGESITDAVITALRERLAREEGRISVPGLKDEILAISKRCAALPDVDTRSAEEILGYDEHGLPR
jgi:antitoxin VapB